MKNLSKGIAIGLSSIGIAAVAIFTNEPICLFALILVVAMVVVWDN